MKTSTAPPVRQSIVRRLSYVVGAVVGASGLAILPAAATSAIYREWADFRSLLISSLLIVAIGAFFWRYVGRRGGELTSKEGFAIVGISWFAISAFGALPYVIS